MLVAPQGDVHLNVNWVVLLLHLPVSHVITEPTRADPVIEGFTE
jgi:hypothetical protein